MAAHVHGHAAARAADVVKVGRVGTVVLLALLEQRRAAERSRVEKLLEPYIFGCEAEFFGVHQLHAGAAARGEHGVGLGQVEAQRLLADDVLAGLGSGQGEGGVGVVGGGDDDHIDVGRADEFQRVGRAVGNVEPPGEGLRIRRRGRGDGRELSARALQHTLRMDAGDELRADDANANRASHGRCAPGLDQRRQSSRGTIRAWDEWLPPRPAGPWRTQAHGNLDPVGLAAIAPDPKVVQIGRRLV